MSTPEQRRSGAELFARVFDLDDTSEAATRPVPRLCNLILTECMLGGYPEIRVLAPEGGGAQVRYGSGEQWKDVMKVPDGVHGPVVNRFKVMANLDVARRPSQEGVLLVRRGGKDFTITINVETTPGGAEQLWLRFSGANP